MLIPWEFKICIIIVGELIYISDFGHGILISVSIRFLQQSMQFFWPLGYLLYLLVISWLEVVNFISQVCTSWRKTLDVTKILNTCIMAGSLMTVSLKYMWDKYFWFVPVDSEESNQLNIDGTLRWVAFLILPIWLMKWSIERCSASFLKASFRTLVFDFCALPKSDVNLLSDFLAYTY